MAVEPESERSAPSGRQRLPDDPVRWWSNRLHALLGVPPTTGNEVEVLTNGDRIFAAMLDAIDRAERDVDFVTFVWWKGEITKRFAASFAAAAARGCRVRVLVDQLGGRKISDELIEQMRSAGVEFRWFRPLFDKVPKVVEANRRTHRKILVCDGRVGFCGGVGIAEEWCGDARHESEWRDTHLEVRGPVVAGLHSAFLDNWVDHPDEELDPANEYELDFAEHGRSTCFVVRGAAETGSSDVWNLMMALVTLARRSVTIATAYFNPDDQMLHALSSAVERGVFVTLLVPGEHADKRFIQIAGEQSYAELLDAGVSIVEYQVSMMHAKVVTVDGVIATVGSCNLNQRSMQHDEEANVVVVDPVVVAELDARLAEDLASSTEIDPAEWAERGLGQRLAERAANVVERWL
ncbi:MAG: phospholipase D-like domain-containing protein [Actinomycetota bacterium]